MSNITDINQYRAKQDDELLDYYEDMEDEIRVSMRESVAVQFVDRMVNHYGVSPTLIIQDIMGYLLSRTIAEINSGDEGGKEILAWMVQVGASIAEDFDVDFSEEARGPYLDAMFRHRNGERCVITKPTVPGNDTEH